MRGGMFLDYDGDTSNIQKLVDQISAHTSRQALAEALFEFSNLLESSADGHSIESYYQSMPEALKGYIEVGYDVSSRASIRLIESLLYLSPAYDKTLQGFLVTHSESDDRPFVLSTPRVENEQSLMLLLPFDHENAMAIQDLRNNPQSFDRVKELFQWDTLNSAQQVKLESFLTEEAPEVAEGRSYDGEGVRIRYFGHATVQLQTKDITIITDPFVSYDNGLGINRFSLKDLPDKIDYVVLTHNHQDHVLFEVLFAMKSRISTIVVPQCNGGSIQDPSLKLIMEAVGFDNVIAMDEMEKLPVSGGYIQALPFLGEHGDLHIRSKLGFYFNLENTGVLCLADSNNLSPEMYQHIQSVLAPVDHMFIGLECAGAPMSWLYGALLNKPLDRKKDQSRRLNGSDATKAQKMVEQFNPASVFIYALGAEPWLVHISSIVYEDNSLPIVESNKLLELLKAKDIVGERMYAKREMIVQKRAISFIGERPDSPW
jgi:L-ascorbate metabolism protein UlaG (beta-lactamase superfamily)